jgi:hypothetical protein
MHERFWLQNVKEIDHLEILGKEEITILKLVLKKYDGSASTGFSWLRIWTCEDDNEISGSIKCKKFLD